MGNYRAFIAAADALLEIREEVSSIDKHLESLVDFCCCCCFFFFYYYFGLNFSLRLCPMIYI